MPYEGNQVLLVRVRSGLNTPYNLNLRDHGIYLRGGKDGDRRASVREIQMLFKRGVPLSQAEAMPWARTQRQVFSHLAGQHIADHLPFLMIGLTPAFPIEPVALDAARDRAFRDLYWRMFSQYGE